LKRVLLKSKLPVYAATHSLGDTSRDRLPKLCIQSFAEYGPSHQAIGVLHQDLPMC
jgi:hypothetical protein